jgi:hypothetical protein
MTAGQKETFLALTTIHGLANVTWDRHSKWSDWLVIYLYKHDIKTKRLVLNATGQIIHTDIL